MKQVVFVLLSLFLVQTVGLPLEIQSPNQQIRGVFDVRDFEGISQRLVYQVLYKDQTIVAPLPIRFEIEDASPLLHFTVLSSTNEARRSHWEPVYGERRLVHDNYNQLILHLQDSTQPQRKLDLIVRAYDEGLAFCFHFLPLPHGTPFTILREETEFRFTGNHTAWATYSAQGEYQAVPLREIQSGCERPLTIQIEEQTYAALAEARMVDYARTKFGPLQTGPGVVTELSSPVVVHPPFSTPWRVIMLADRPGDLLENNDILLNLNEPCAIADFSWVKPGKVIREVSLTTAGGKACVDFAVKYNLQYVEFDAGWYGLEYDESADATTVTLDPQRSKGPLDLPEVIAYAKQKGIGVLLYVNRRALERQLDTILPLYQSWGIQGVKYGFVNVGSQQWSTWLHEAVRKAAAHRLMVDIHDEYRPTGYSRTYPNLMTQEGIRGDETKPSNELSLTLLFTRMLAGAGDNTICYYDPRVTDNACHAYQLAKAVCFYSPWQFLFWYDTPAEIEQEENPELAFFRDIPTVWDDTKVVHGQIGAYAVIARRSGEAWFIGAMNNDEPRTLPLPLDFLNPEKQYTATLYSHDPTVPTRTHVKIEQMVVNATTILSLDLQAKAGIAIHVQCKE